MSEGRTRPHPDLTGTSLSPRLDSWKEIAVYLKRDIRTVQLWEKNEALPIHRHFHMGRASVYAHTSELDAWWNSRDKTPPQGTGAGAKSGSEGDESPRATHPKRLLLRLLIGFLVVTSLGVGATITWQRLKRRKTSTVGTITLAVLPFESLSTSQDDSFLADGLTDDIISDLGMAGRLQVISRTSVMQFKGKHELLPQIAQTLHANLVVEGTLIHVGGQVRITAQLIDANSNKQLWAGSYEHEYKRVLSLQDDAAGEVTVGVLDQLPVGSAFPVRQTPLVESEARIAYLKGRFYWNQRDEAGLKEAITYFSRATQRAPNYAPAYAGLADCYNLMSVWGSLTPKEAFPLARQSALKAVQLDPSLAEAYTSLAFEMYRYEWDFAGSETDFQKAIGLDPNYTTAHQWYGEFLVDLARFDQGIAELRKAKEIDPLSPIVESDLAAALVHARRGREAVAELEDVLKLRPDFVPAHFYLSTAYAIAGDPIKSRQEKLLYTRLSGDQAWREQIELQDDLASGNKKDAQALYQKMARHVQEGRSGNYQMAELEILMGHKDLAFVWLDKAYREHSWWLVTMMVDPWMDPIRNDPRFDSLIRRVGLRGKP
ncbi:MAG TPA: hypothetical protein VG028_04565 [Terriglobia bacterium]|nr:hypothetical protein [Terriglobia bacterium]